MSKDFEYRKKDTRLQLGDGFDVLEENGSDKLAAVLSNERSPSHCPPVGEEGDLVSVLVST